MTRQVRLPRRNRMLTAEQSRLVWQSASLLLDYPDQALADRLGLVERAAELVPPAARVPLTTAVRRLSGMPLVELEADYVDTFDSRRRHNLYLTYFAYGDTRKRGMALLRFKQTYLASGFAVSEEELPDHLCVVLEYAATVDQDRGRALMLDHRAGLELLRLSLSEARSRWAGAVEAVTATLPPLQGDDIEAVRRLAAQGPPEEEVGLSPYAVPTFNPGPARPAEPVVLPMPTFPGGR